MNNPPAIVVLAAGPGRRFAGDSHKLAQHLHGHSVLETTLAQAVRSGLPLVVVTTSALAPLAVRVVALRDIVEIDAAAAARGIGHSIALGVGACANASGWLLMPADMPLVQPTTMRAVAEALALHAVAFAQHRGLPGQPVGFAGELYSELVQLSGEHDAHRIVARYPALGVEVDDAGVLMGIDNVAQLGAVRAALAQRSLLVPAQPVSGAD